MADTRACLVMASASSLKVASLVGSAPHGENARQHFRGGHRRPDSAAVQRHGNSSNVDLQTLKWRRECRSGIELKSSNVACGIGKALGTCSGSGGPAFGRNVTNVEALGTFGVPGSPAFGRNVTNVDAGRNRGAAGGSQDRGRLVPGAVVKEEEQAGQASVQTISIKDYLEDLKAVGRVRLIVNTGVAVLESVTSLETLFYHPGPRGEYANVMNREDNVDFHLLLEKVASAKLAKGKSMKGDIPTYMVRFMDASNASAVTVLVMWKPGTDGEYDPGQVEGFQALQEKYGEEVNFLSV